MSSFNLLSRWYLLWHCCLSRSCLSRGTLCFSELLLMGVIGCSGFQSRLGMVWSGPGQFLASSHIRCPCRHLISMPDATVSAAWDTLFLWSWQFCCTPLRVWNASPVRLFASYSLVLHRLTSLPLIANPAAVIPLTVNTKIT